MITDKVYNKTVRKEISGKKLKNARIFTAQRHILLRTDIMTGAVSEGILTFCKIFFVKRLTNIKLRVIIYKHSGE